MRESSPHTKKNEKKKKSRKEWIKRREWKQETVLMGQTQYFCIHRHTCIMCVCVSMCDVSLSLDRAQR